ncbi:hypothetical protein T05_13539, partial [Trichinella murrelli]
LLFLLFSNANFPQQFRFLCYILQKKFWKGPRQTKKFFLNGLKSLHAPKLIHRKAAHLELP